MKQEPHQEERIHGKTIAEGNPREAGLVGKDGMPWLGYE